MKMLHLRPAEGALTLVGESLRPSLNLNATPTKVSAP